MDNSTLKTIDSGLKGCGTLQFWLQLLSSILFIVCFIMSGFFTVKQKNEFTAKTGATITKANCTQQINRDNKGNQSVSYNCNTQVKYNVGGEEYNNQLLLNSSSIYSDGDNIDIDYNEQNPNKITHNYIKNYL